MGLIYGSCFEDIPYMAPLMGMLELPLFVTESEIYSQIQTQYPLVNVQQCSPNQLGKTLLSTTNTLISCLPTSKIRHIFQLEETMQKKQLHTIFLPHGYEADMTSEVLKEKNLFFFGPKMSDTLYALSDHIRFKHLINLGNYRSLYAKYANEPLMEKEELAYTFTQFTSLEEIKRAVIPRLKEIATLDNTFF